MKPFVCSLLKCKTCGCTDLFRPVINQVTQSQHPPLNIDISGFRKYPEFLINLIDSIQHLRTVSLDVVESDVYLFVEDGIQEVDKIINLLTGYDITEGSLICPNPECGVEFPIKNNILRFTNDNSE